MRSNSVFILFRGRVVFTTPRNSIFRHFVEGSYFGEIEIFKNSTRQFSVLAISECELMELSRENFYTIMKDFPELEIDVVRIALERDIRFKQAINKISALDELLHYEKFWKATTSIDYMNEFKEGVNKIVQSNNFKPQQCEANSPN